MNPDTRARSRRRPASRGAWEALRALLALTIVTVWGCGDAAGLRDDRYDIQFDFSNGYQGWVASFADYPVGKEAEWAIGSAIAPLPAPLDGTRKGILLTGDNHSDDLFMYLSQEGTLLAPNANYTVRFQVTLATNAPKNCAGIGGAPGESVVLKVGVIPFAPARTVDGAGYYRTNFDYGNQLANGSHAIVVGNMATSNTNCSLARYELKTFDTGDGPVRLTTSASGKVWLMIGVDSGFEGTTAVYVTAARVTIEPS